MWHLKHDTNELFYETETESQTQNPLAIAKGGGVEARTEWESGTRSKLIYRMDRQPGLTVQPRDLHSVSYDKPQWKRI